MDEHLPLALQIEEWTRQAIGVCGDDWKKIAAYLDDRLAELSEAERARIMAEVAFTLHHLKGGKPDTTAH